MDRRSKLCRTPEGFQSQRSSTPSHNANTDPQHKEKALIPIIVVGHFDRFNALREIARLVNLIHQIPRQVCRRGIVAAKRKQSICVVRRGGGVRRWTGTTYDGGGGGKGIMRVVHPNSFRPLKCIYRSVCQNKQSNAGGEEGVKRGSSRLIYV